jgi:hypothetical protein
MAGRVYVGQSQGRGIATIPLRQGMTRLPGAGEATAPLCGELVSEQLRSRELSPPMGCIECDQCRSTRYTQAFR